MCAYNPKPLASDEERDRHWRSVCEIGWQVVDIGPARKVRLLSETGGTKLLELMADEPDATFDMLAAEMPPPRPPKTSNQPNIPSLAR